MHELGSQLRGLEHPKAWPVAAQEHVARLAGYLRVCRPCKRMRGCALCMLPLPEDCSRCAAADRRRFSCIAQICNAMLTGLSLKHAVHTRTDVGHLLAGQTVQG